MSDSSFADPNERVRKLSKEAASQAEIDFSIPLIRYFRGSKEIIRIAQYYENENCLENAFFLYSKYITMFVEKFPHHPQYKVMASKEKQTYYKGLPDVFTRAEHAKHKLLKIYSNELKEMEIIQAKVAEEKRKQESLSNCKTNASQNDELLALERRFQQMKQQEQQILMNISPQKIFPNINNLVRDTSTNIDINYEAIPPPAYDSAIRDATYSSIKTDDKSSQSPIKPQFDRSLKPLSFSSQEVGSKTVYVPSDLAHEFMARVQLNTDKNIETCAILCGRLQQQNWRITHILIPNQLGKSDSCDIENDEELVEFQDRQDLVTLGWIHTHPSQTAFLSSVDQHTHWPYQKLLPEAISIVCAPKFKEIGYFHLTPNFGMDFIQNCKGKGFHEHPIKPPIFQTAPHILLEPFPRVIVEDLRRNMK